MTSQENNGEVICHACGFHSRAGAKFCGGCGEHIRVNSFCTECGAENDAVHKFCVHCGNRLDGAPAVAQSDGKSGIFSVWDGLPSRAKWISAVAVAAIIVVAAFAVLRGGGDDSDVAASSLLSMGAPSAPFAHLEPNPSGLVIRSEPTEHHAVEMVSNVSAVIKAGPPGAARLVVHNDTDLVERDGCAAVSPAPDGNHAVLLIKPEDIRGEWRARFFVVGCSPGDATIEIESDGVTLASYPITVSEL